jgi:hypothetical protein
VVLQYSIGVNLVEVARQAGKVDDFGGGKRARWRDDLLANLEVFEVAPAWLGIDGHFSFRRNISKSAASQARAG